MDTCESVSSVLSQSLINLSACVCVCVCVCVGMFLRVRASTDTDTQTINLSQFLIATIYAFKYMFIYITKAFYVNKYKINKNEKSLLSVAITTSAKTTMSNLRHIISKIRYIRILCREYWHFIKNISDAFLQTICNAIISHY